MATTKPATSSNTLGFALLPAFNMRKVNLCHAVTLLRFVHDSLAIPVAHVVPRSRFCTNAPTIIAGSMLDRRASSHNVIWCAANSETFVTLTIGTFRGVEIVRSIINPVSLTVYNHLLEIGDGVLRAGSFVAQAASTRMVFRVWNANNHQLTWGVLSAAIKAVTNYMSVEGVWADVQFDIYDGGIQVGQGVILGP